LSLPDDELVSQRHARITPSDEGLLIEDLESRNGTFVNGAQVASLTPLRAGDRIVVGETAIEVGLAEPPAGGYLLLVSSQGGPAHEVSLDEPLVLGRDPAAGLPLPDDEQISWRHARLAPRPDGVAVEDLDSTNGTFVDGVRIAQTTVVAAGSRLFVGETAIEVVARPHVDTAVVPGLLSADTIASVPAPVPKIVLEVVGPDGTSRELPLSEPLEVGRDPAVGLVLDDQLVSRRHARLTPGAGQVTIEDLGSTNGTFVNEAPIEDATVAAQGDRIVVGKTTIVVSVALTE
jgi:pSer/pThr/pTyr-binding forkhead associated (FHA) protein